MEKPTPNEEDLESTPQEEDESDLDALFEDDDQSSGEDKESEFLAKINELENRSYKSLEDWKKTNEERKKIADKHYSEQGKKKVEEPKEETPKSSGNDKYAEKLLKLENPNSQYVMDDLRAISKDRNIDILEAWDKFSWIRKEAEVRAEEASENIKNGKKVSKPSQKISGTKGIDAELSDADRALLSRKPGLMEKYLKSNN